MIKSLSPRLEKVLIDAERLAFERGHESIQTDHVLLALFYETGGTGHEALAMLGVNEPDLVRVIDKLAPALPREKTCHCCSGTGKIRA